MQTPARYEFKYLLPPERLAAVREWARTWCGPDAYGADGVYAVHSLYFDTDGWRLARQTLDGLRERFKARVRTYGWTDADPVFVELKGRVGTSVLKQRARIGREQVDALCAGGAPPPGGFVAANPAHQRDLVEFRNRQDRLDLRPRLWVSYVREAYQSRFGDGGRITFDVGLRVQPPDPERLFHPDEDRWVPVALPAPIVVELKFNGAFPRWMLHLVRALELRRESCSKYLHGAQRAGATPWSSLGGQRWTVC